MSNDTKAAITAILAGLTIGLAFDPAWISLLPWN